MVRVMDSALFGEDVLIYPFSDFGSRNQPGIRQPVFASEVDGGGMVYFLLAWSCSPQRLEPLKKPPCKGGLYFHVILKLV